MLYSERNLLTVPTRRLTPSTWRERLSLSYDSRHSFQSAEPQLPASHLTHWMTTLRKITWNGVPLRKAFIYSSEILESCRCGVSDTEPFYTVDRAMQQFVEMNATGFRKILKKWDKRSKSSTKELYLARQVDVQPVFNRQVRSIYAPKSLTNKTSILTAYFGTCGYGSRMSSRPY